MIWKQRDPWGGENPYEGEYWCGQEEKDAGIKRIYGHMVRLKGGSSTTVTNSYTPTAGEQQLSQASADYARKVAPNAYYLNDLARNLLQNSLGAVQVDYNTMNSNAQKQIASAMGGMAGLLGSNNGATAAANGALGNISGQMGALAAKNAGRLGALSGMYQNAATGANAALSRAGNTIGQAAGAANRAIGSAGGMIGQSANAANNVLMRSGNVIGQAANAANGSLARAGTVMGQSANAANGLLGSLANGTLPAGYQRNMENSIRSALTNTMGRTLSDLGSRGVLNSSVTTGAMNDIQRNAADEVARQYQSNIGQVAGLAQQQNANIMNAAGAQANLTQQQNANLTNAANAQAGFAQQANANQMNAAGALANLAQQQNANMANAANAQAGFAQQQHANTTGLAGNLGNLYNTQYTQLSNTLGQQANMAQQQLSNTQGNSAANAGIYQNLIHSAANPLATAAAAQEAAQNPAFNAWRASLGLGGATTNALAGIAGKGTSTQTTTNSGGGNFFTGLLGGVLGGGAQALGAGFFCFPPGTKIKMADGTQKSIEHIDTGERVMSYADGVEKEAEVLHTMQRHYADVYNIIAGSDHTSATLTQPFLMADGTYRALADLRMGDLLHGKKAVQGIVYSGERPVHDLEVSGANTYIADGFPVKGGDRATWQE
jgi:hypothetical protein